MDVDRSFRRALRRATRGHGQNPSLLPDALAAAAVDALSAVDGASLSVLSEDLRIPLGACDDTSARAEALEATIGEGPCLEAIRNNMLIDGSAVQLHRRWPVLAEAWTTQTPYRSALSVPVPLAADTGCALNLYFIGETGAAAIDLMPAVTIGLLIATELLDGTPGPPPRPGQHLAGWLDSPSATRRQRLWVAIGKTTQATGLSNPDALELLRSRAYAQNRTLDDLAGDIITNPDVTRLLEP